MNGPQGHPENKKIRNKTFSLWGENQKKYKLMKV
jgi:hypothetical protein